MTLRIATLLAAGLLATACTTMTPEERRAAEEAQCRDYGFRKGTDAFAECLQRIELDRRAQRRATMHALDHWDRPIVIYRPVPVRVK